MQLYSKRYSYTPYNNKIWNAAMHTTITRINTNYDGLRKRFSYCFDQSVSLCKFPKNNIVNVYSISMPLNEIKALSFRKFKFTKFGRGMLLFNKSITIKRFTNFPLGYSNKINRILVDLEEYYAG